jgi:hypothetical protein
MSRIAAQLRVTLHTDEYEISLSREIVVCNGFIKSYQRRLSTMEGRHGMTTEEFLDYYLRGKLITSSTYEKWLSYYEELKHWVATRDEYEQLLHIMKISAT